MRYARPLAIGLALAVAAQLVIITALIDSAPEIIQHSDIGKSFRPNSFARVAIDIVEADDPGHPDAIGRLNPYPRTLYMDSNTIDLGLSSVIWTNLTDETIHMSIPNHWDSEDPTHPDYYNGFIPPHEYIILKIPGRGVYHVHMHVDDNPGILPVVGPTGHTIIWE